MTIATNFEQVTNNSPDGAQMGKGTSEKVAFYGSTPVVQPTSANQTAVTITAANPAAATAAASSLTASATETLTAADLTINSTQGTPNTTIVSTVNTLTTGNGSGMSATNESEINALFVLCDDNFADISAQLDAHVVDSADQKVAIDQNVVDVADQKQEIDKLVTDYGLGRAQIVKLVTDVTATLVLVNQLRSELVTLGLLKGS